MGNRELGEHSRKTRNSGSEEETLRPFKKARYVWQLKGKYHLKETSRQKLVHSNEDLHEKSTSSNESDSDTENMCGNNNNVSATNNNLKCNERCCIDELLTKSDALLDNDDSDQELTNNIDRSISNEIPITLVKLNNKNHDEYLQKWQARQVAKSFVDNTINSILEHWKIPFDAADFVENCETDEQVEDEGILMAIQSHGLQSGLRYSAPNPNIQPPVKDGEGSRCQTHTTNTNLPLSNDEIAASTLDNYENVQNERIMNYSHENNDSLDMEDPMDFLNTAVSVAIQGKGLSSYNYG